MDTKYFITSKRFWINALTIGIGIWGVVTTQFPVSPEIGAIVLGIINLVLAQISKQPLGFKR